MSGTAVDRQRDRSREYQLARACYSWPRMIAELEKCDVRCISCHSTRHWADKRSRP